jgi:uncharacterized membrane protein (UPF0136 family)
MQSPLTVGILMIAMAGIGLAPLGPPPRPPIGVVQLAIAGVLVIAGVLLVMRRQIGIWFAFGAAAVLSGTGVAALLGARHFALPVPPAISIVIGLYLFLRVAMARAGLKSSKPKGTLPPPEEG